ncbi:unnamed protein product [Moneuplotes crassus]|uniref:Uncharacterized protein n=1 Tax=Euplotes crassus TaxID=5936 RepID=A0AAD1XKZ7_EUPCR|nr:unnamed protein product [Moneuplotes crassus]
MKSYNLNPEIPNHAQARANAMRLLLQSERKRSIQSLSTMKRLKGLRAPKRNTQHQINITVTTCDNSKFLGNQELKISKEEINEFIVTKSLERISNCSIRQDMVPSSQLEKVPKLTQKVLLEGRRSKQGIPREKKFSRMLKRVRMNLQDWHSHSKMRKIFDDVRRSGMISLLQLVDSGKELVLKDIGLKRTPIFKIQERENLERQRAKRKNFFMNLRADQECIRTSQLGINWERSYDSLERVLNEGKFREGNEEKSPQHSISHPYMTKFLRSNDKTIGKHLKLLQFRRGSFQVHESFSEDNG